MPADYSMQDLRGRSFKCQDLIGANFSYADIRSADFTGANLTLANFSHAKAGLQKRWATFLVLVSCLICGLVGFLSVFAGALINILFNISNLSDQVSGWSALIEVIVVFIVIIRQGLNSAVAVAFAFAVAIAFAVVFAGAGVFAGAFPGAFAFAFSEAFAFAFTVAFAVAFTAAFTAAFAVAFAVAFAFAVAGAFAFTGAFAGAVAVAFTGAFAGAFVLAFAKAFAFGVAAAFAGVYAGAVVLLSTYISWLTLKGDPKHGLIRDIAIASAAFKGTSFRSADLTDANFTEAILKSTDFRTANLTRTCWQNAKKIDRARPGITYLQNLQVRQLLITGEGKNQNFERLDLRGLNLREANLENASFIDADFYKSNLSSANLSRAILVRTNFESSDLSYARLTGSCIQDWTISRGTQLDGIICDYVYLKWVEGDRRDQMPTRGKFKKGGFVLFAKYILDTIDIYHNKDINPRLALTVLKKMSRHYDEPLDIVAVGKRGDKVFMKVKLSENVEHEEFKEDYFCRYENGLKLLSSSSKTLPSVDELIESRLAEIGSDKTDEISNINITHVEYLKTPKDIVIQGEVTVETIETGGDTIYQKGSFGIGVNKGEVHAEKFTGTITENNPMSNNYDLSHAKIGGGFAGTGGTQSGGTFYDYSSNPSLAEAAIEIQQLLQQLEGTNPTTTSANKRAVVNQAIDAIENNPALKARVIAALESSSAEAFKAAINHPLAKNMMPFIEELTATE